MVFLFAFFLVRSYSDHEVIHLLRMDSTLKRFISFIAIIAFSFSLASAAFASGTPAKNAAAGSQEEVAKATPKKASASNPAKIAKGSAKPSSAV